jgi:2-oxoglutarate dehydrogenase E1 component
MRAVHVAADYHAEFGKDVVIDVVCYRRWGHNEGDEPAYTQPVLYSKIREHPTVRENYVELLLRRGDFEREEAEAIGSRFDEELRAALTTTQAEPPRDLPLDEVLDLSDDDPVDWFDGESPPTGVPAEELVEIIDRTNRIPEGHVTHPNLLRQLRRRERMVRGEMDLDWGCAETSAYASLLRDGVSIRLAGQDSRRGTFSHRHSVIRDQVTEVDWIPLAELAPEGASFESWDSLLSEEAALAFEYGYAHARADSLVLWEAQFGDFTNGAQIPIDQFVASGESKWKQLSGVVLLLPHGYDGQGPEHSSARPERFLGLCSGGNMTVANCTTSGQFFHLLRRQGRSPEKRPLVVFTPKSGLRDKRAASPVGHLTEGGFRQVILDPPRDASGPVRVVACTGKVYFDLAQHRDEEGLDDLALLRLEQLYPFPRRAFQEALEELDVRELVWAQEEPRNMGAWSFVLQRMLDLGREVRYAGRPESASPATGSYHRHLAEQAHLVRRACSPD